MEAPKLNQKLEIGLMREPTYGPISLDLKEKKVLAIDSGESQHLTDQEYQVLWMLVRAQGAMLSKIEMEGFLYEDISEEKDLPLTNGLEVILKSLRSKLRTVAGEKISIENLKNIGWRLQVS
jgi:DNA-binding response OmpR family regulator